MSQIDKARKYLAIMATQLRENYSNHELLRLTEETPDPARKKRLEMELLERFSGGATGSKEKIEAVALVALARAMGKAAGEDPEAMIPSDILEALRQEGLRPETLKIELRRVRVRLDPPIDIFNLTMSSSTGTWMHTATGESELQHFLEGAQAAVGCLGGHLPLPEIPRSPDLTIGPEDPVW